MSANGLKREQGGETHHAVGEGECKLLRVADAAAAAAAAAAPAVAAAAAAAAA